MHPEGDAPRWFSSYAALKRLIISSSALAAGFWIVQRPMQPFESRLTYLPDVRALTNAYQATRDVESNEISWMMLSIPVVVAALAVSYAIVRAAGSLLGLCRRVTVWSVLVSCSLAVGCLWKLSESGAASVRRHREYALIESRRNGGHLIKDFQGDVNELISRNLQQLLLDIHIGEAETRFASRAYDFAPPLSPLLLWQGPHRASH
jgi:hypothetical protein